MQNNTLVPQYEAQFRALHGQVKHCFQQLEQLDKRHLSLPKLKHCIAIIRQKIQQSGFVLQAFDSHAQLDGFCQQLVGFLQTKSFCAFSLSWLSWFARHYFDLKALRIKPSDIAFQVNSHQEMLSLANDVDKLVPFLRSMRKAVQLMQAYPPFVSHLKQISMLRNASSTSAKKVALDQELSRMDRLLGLFLDKVVPLLQGYARCHQTAGGFVNRVQCALQRASVPSRASMSCVIKAKLAQLAEGMQAVQSSTANTFSSFKKFSDYVKRKSTCAVAPR